METKKIFILSTLFLCICFFYGFGFHHLAQFKTADEHYWIQERTPAYWNALKEEKYKKTLINDKPGITVALVSGIGLLWEKNPVQHLTKIDDDLKVYDTTRSERINLIFRLPILLFNGLFLLLLFWIIKKSTQNSWIALWSTVFMSLSPILIGISQIINPDSLLWTFSTGAIFSYFALLKTGEKKFIFLASLFSGLSILSKYTADILFPFFFFSMLAYYLIEIRGTDEKRIRSFFFSQIPNFFFIIIGSLATVTAFLPAVIIKPIYLYRLTLGFGPMKLIAIFIIVASVAIIIDQFLPKRSFLLLCKKHQNFFSWALKPFLVLLLLIFAYLIIGRGIFHNWKLFDVVPFDIKELGYIKGYFFNIWEKIIIQFNPLVFSLTPIVLFLTIFLWIISIFKKNMDYFFHTFSITFFILVYYLAYIFMDVVAIVRYSIVLYPLLCFLAALGLWQAHMILKRYMQRTEIIFTFLALIFSFSSLYWARPFYFNYTNFILPQKYIISDAWGYGGYEAAQYLNSLPNSKNLTVWADYYGVCEFFIGKCLTDYNLTTDLYSIDYYILTRRGEIRYWQGQSRWDLPGGIKAGPYYEDPNPLWKLEINGRSKNFIKILKSNPQ